MNPGIFRIQQFLPAIRVLVIVLSSLSLAWADKIVLDDNHEVSGEIKYQDDDQLKIVTEQYGELTFKKYLIRRIFRGGQEVPVNDTVPALPAGTGSAATPAPSGAGAAPPSNPFALAGSGIQPVAAGPTPAGPGGPPAGPANPVPANPFGMGAPGADAATPTPEIPPGGPGAPSNPFGGPDTGMGPGAGSGQPPVNPAAPVTPSPTPGPTFAPSDLASLQLGSEPEVPSGFDGILFGIGANSGVQWRKSAQDNFEPARNESTLMVGNEVKTGSLGKAKIRLRGRDSLRIPPQSHIRLTAMSPDASQVTLDVISGSLWSRVSTRSQPGDFKVQTPDLTAGVRGTLFKTTVTIGKGTRIALYEGSVEALATKTQQTRTLLPATSVFVNSQGQIEPPIPILSEEYDEFKVWDEWKAQTYKDLGVFSSVGAPLIAGMLNGIAQDNARHEQMSNETNRQIVFNKFEENLKFYRDAFLQFARDTGHIPDDKTESWAVLQENKGNWPGWKGPYLKNMSLPPLDPLRHPVHYKLRPPSKIGNIIGLVYSNGLDQRDNQGETSTDDEIVLIMYYTLPEIANNPAYKAAAPPTQTPAALQQRP